jgi:hypothetical protein
VKWAAGPKCTSFGRYKDDDRPTCTFYQTAVKEFEVPAGVTEIPDYCFWEAPLEKVTFAGDRAALTRIGCYAFSKTKLTEVKLPKSLQHLGVGAFAQCELLTACEIPPDSNVEVINDDCFAGTKLKRIHIPSKTKIIGQTAFFELRDLEVTWGDNPQIEKIGMRAFAYTQIGPELRFGEQFIFLSTAAFEGCKNLKKFVLPSKSQLTTVHQGAFRDSGVELVVCPGAEIVVLESFQNCANLRHVIFTADDCFVPNHRTQCSEKVFASLDVVVEFSQATLKEANLERMGLRPGSVGHTGSDKE